jgi:uncharacterized membrane protein
LTSRKKPEHIYFHSKIEVVEYVISLRLSLMRITSVGIATTASIRICANGFLQ